MRRFLYIGIALLALALPALSDTDAEPSNTIGAAFTSKYLWRGMDLLNGNAALQPHYNRRFGDSGLDFDVWGSLAIQNRDVEAIGKADELDFTLTYSKSLASGDWKLGVFELNYPRQTGWRSGESCTHELFTGFTFTTVPLTPSITYYRAVNQHGDNGNYALLSLSQTMVSDSKVPVSLTLQAGYSDQAWFVDGSGDQSAGISHVDWIASGDYKLEDLKLVPTFIVSFSPNKNIIREQTNFAFGIGIEKEW